MNLQRADHALQEVGQTRGHMVVAEMHSFDLFGQSGQCGQLLAVAGVEPGLDVPGQRGGIVSV